MKVGTALAGLLALAAPAAAAAAPEPVTLPGPGWSGSTAGPPLPTSASTPTYIAPGMKIGAATRVLAGVGPDGRMVSVRVRQRLVVSGKGDYQLVVGAPVLDVRAGPGSQSEPGFRTDQILWAGFSAERKVLVADARLRPAPAVTALPVRIELDHGGERWSLTVTNATATSEKTFTGEGSARELASLLDQTRRDAEDGTRLSPAFATLRGGVRAEPRPVRVAAPLRVTGALRFEHGRPVSFARTLGDGRPLRARVGARGAGRPRLRLQVSPLPAVGLLRPPGAPSWREAIRRRRIPARALLRRLVVARMQTARADQYETYLSNPDPLGGSRTIYVYETASAPTLRPPQPSSSTGMSGALVALIAVTGSIVAAGALLVVWAHS